jgi:hypothetical protein
LFEVRIESDEDELIIEVNGLLGNGMDDSFKSLNDKFFNVESHKVLEMITFGI